MFKSLSMFTAGVLLLAGQGQSRADKPPLVRNDGGASLSNLKLTGPVPTEDIRWRRGYYYGGYYGYGYGYPAYYGSYYNSPAYYSSPYYATGPNYGYSYPSYGYGVYPYFGFRGGYRGYRRIDMTDAPPAATNLSGTGRLISPAPAAGSIRLTQFLPSGQGPADSRNNYDYNGGPKSIVPMPNGGGFQQQFTPAPERPAIPRDGLPVSFPRGMTAEVTTLGYYGQLPTAAATFPAPVGQSSTQIAYPAYGDPR